MTLRPHQRNLVVFSPFAGSGVSYGAPRFTQPARTRRIRRCIRTGALLTVIGLIRLARAVQPRWRPTLAGVVLTVAGVMLRSGPASVVFFPGVLFLMSALLTPASPKAARTRRSELQRELAAYSTPAQRADFEATLDQYPDRITYELRDILASQAMAAARNHRPPDAGR